jgi:NAD(P)-dependent dehydrogenase (short-subunit alcohol dehydrogenase family)
MVTLKGQKVFVTGGSRGLGLGIVEALVAQKAQALLFSADFELRMRRPVEVNGLRSLMAQYYEGKQHAKADCRHDQEINRHLTAGRGSQKKCATFARVAFLDEPYTWLLLLERSVFPVSAIHHEF